MGLFNSNENRVKCGKCNTEFDLNKNAYCPLCKFGSGDSSIRIKHEQMKGMQKEDINYLAIPNDAKFKSGNPKPDNETKIVGSWGMFNSFFPGKAVLRISANMINEKKTEYLILDDLVNKSKEIFKINGLSKLRGFPNNLEKENAISRLVHHFIQTFNDMGFFVVKAKEKNKEYVWNEPWKNIEITLTKEGLDFAKLRNRIFDDHEPIQVLTEEEKEWLLKYLEQIDQEGYKEYTLLMNVFAFIKQGKNGKDDLWGWFKTNPTFIKYVKEWSKKSGDAFEKQIENLSPTFAASKVALLRELGVIKNKRNDYSVIGEF